MDGAHEVLNGAFFADVDIGVAAVLEDAELCAESKIDRAASEFFRREGGRDSDLAKLEIAVNIDVGEYHNSSARTAILARGRCYIEGVVALLWRARSGRLAQLGEHHV